MGCTQNCNLNQTCLRLVPIFEGISSDDVTTLQAVTKSQSYKKGDIIFREGERSESLFIIQKGLIKLSKVSVDGKEQIIRLLFQGDFFGQFALLQNESHYANAEVLEETIVCTIAKKTFLSTLEKSPSMALRFINDLNNRLYHADEWMSLLSLMDVEQRLARILLLFLNKLENTNGYFTLPISKRDLASLIGTTPETLSRKLVFFVTQDIIQLKHRREIQVVDYNKLTFIAGL
ncbi:Crp/Fnr family transcriptional regulator [Anaerobacillus sp. CMMVII]|uniref:Crp/Fnr family transcriptional regulator n=1 Tax=Anaerobacillus sp. CMMVII TaxID=2755588 RepID=UPI0021B7B64A|nr:Crp/Fnr family transcriptional regulator [Anaerobacillus sp. CMMVII]MCT8138569.1 Crp/Fnr family transcriptional regulator [Anaerobacillus sp. CMMVII]